MLKRIFLGISLLALLVLGVGFYKEYFAYHPYYTAMVENWWTRRIVLTGFVFGLIPVGYTFFWKKKTFRGYMITVLTGLFLFSASYVALKANMLWFAAYLKLLINIILIMALVVFMMSVFMVVGWRVKERTMQLPTHDVYGVIVNLGIGLGVFLIVNYFLILTNLSFSIVNRALFVIAWRFVYRKRDTLQEYRQFLQATLETFTVERPSHAWLILAALPFVPFLIMTVVSVIWQSPVAFWDGLAALLAVGLIVAYARARNRSWHSGCKELFSNSGRFTCLWFFLLLLTCRYIFNGFILAFIPYPTAWDANHAYMFFPKMRALNNGFYRNEINMHVTPQLRYAYITYRFSLFTPFKSFLGLSADTIAIEMNARSSLFVLIFWTALVAEFMAFLKLGNKETQETLVQNNREKGAILLGRFLLLQWLMSGMGMFLAFIDNKTDLWILSLIILAVYSGFVFLRAVESTENTWRKAFLYALLSWWFYAIATLSKPTALFDVVNFFLFMWWIRIGILGALGILLLVVWLLTLLEFVGIKEYLTKAVGPYIWGAGILAFGIDAVRIFIKKSWTYARYMIIRLASFAALMIICKVPFVIAESIFYDTPLTPVHIIKRVFITNRDTADRVLLAQAGSTTVSKESCTLAGQGFSSTEDLYQNLKEPTGDGYTEDVGRYVGYGRKGNSSDRWRGVTPFIDPRRSVFLKEGCQWFNPLFMPTDDAVVLCENEQQRKSFNPTLIAQVQERVPADGEVYALLEEIRSGIASSSDDDATLRTRFAPQIQELDALMQGNTIKVVRTTTGVEVYVPYRFMNIFNISFNRSLQNLSSYYTDIWVVWLMLIVFVVLGLVYGLLRRHKVLAALSGVTLFGRFLRGLIGGWILWYAIGVIIWTILAFVAYFYVLLSDSEGEESGRSPLFMVLQSLFIGGVVVYCCIQTGLNLARIATQGGGGAFMRYKTNVGLTTVFDDMLQTTQRPVQWFGADEIFALQFPHYNKLISLANSRSADQGIMIAGTYARYFINNQKYVASDQFLTQFQKNLSDGNVCNTYLRLQDQKIKYMALDPNIGTVVQGEGNRSLFNRFFGQVTPNGTIEEDGTFTMLAKLFQGGYIKYVSSNNIGAKYAFTMPDSVFAGISWDQLTVFRARMAVARFFSNAPELTQTIVQLAQQRMRDGMFITDLADILGATIRENILVGLATKPQLTPEDIQGLTDDERRILSQYLYLMQQDEAARQQTVTQLISQSINAWNQIIVLEVVD